MAEAIAARITGRTVSAPAAQWRGLSMAEMAAACLKHSGQRLPANARAGQIIQASLSTSDFPLLLQQSTNRILQDTLAVSPGAARMVCAMRSVPDFRPGRFIQFAGMGTLGEMTEGGPITYAPPAERGESFAVKTFARQVQFTRQMLVNDDLGALDQARLLAGVVVATEAGEFAKMFATNGAGWLRGHSRHGWNQRGAGCDARPDRCKRQSGGAGAAPCPGRPGWRDSGGTGFE
jgi:hypothetical protein